MRNKILALLLFAMTAPLVHASTYVLLVRDTRLQTITGFGAACCDGAMCPFGSDTRPVTLLYGPTSKIGLNIMRMEISPNFKGDLSFSDVGWDTPYDWHGSLPSAKIVKNRGGIVFGTPWSPPGSYKTNGAAQGGNSDDQGNQRGQLREDCYEKFFPWLNTFLAYMKANGVKVDAVQLSAMNSWQHTFEDLDKYKDGIEIKYTVEEEKLDNYSNETSGNASDGYIIQNTNTEKLDIPVLKVWVGKAAKQVTIRLMADGIETSSAVLTEESNWKHTFKDLPKYDDKDGHEIKYTVTEDAIEGYNTSIRGSENEGFTITNSIEGKVSFSVSKKWIGPSADSVTIYLLADGEILQEVKLNSTNSWKYMFTGLEQYKDGVEIKYTIKEKELSGYAISITGSVETGFTVTNVNVKTMNIPIEKKWVGSEGGSVTIRLYADGIEIDKLKLTKSEGWKSKFSDLPIYDAEDGHEIKYTILEDDIEGYTSKISGSAGNGYTVTNTKKETPETDPKKPTTPTTRSSDTPKTGDESNIALWTLILLISGGLLLFLFFRKRKNSETE